MAVAVLVAGLAGLIGSIGSIHNIISKVLVLVLEFDQWPLQSYFKARDLVGSKTLKS